MSKKRKIVVTCLAIVLAVSLAVGGTITYLTGSSGEVKNEFTKNKNGVELDETTGSEYEIVPGTSQDKDPTITATYTLDSYVFVEVTDATEDLVTWYIANGWALLSTTNNTDGSTTYVYYQLLEAEDTSNWTEVTYTNASSYEDGSNHVGEYVYVDATTGVTYYYDSSTGTYTALIHVLEGDKVYYDSSITNADINSAGDISLTFEAHIIQATLSNTENPADPATAYSVATTGGVAVTVSSVSELQAALNSLSSTPYPNYITLPSGSSTVSTLTIAADTNVYLDLNGNSVGTVSLSEGSTLALTDSGSGSGVTSSVTVKNSDASLVVEGVTVNQISVGNSNCTNMSVTVEDGATVGTITTQAHGTTTINGGTITKVTTQTNGTTVINGGTINGNVYAQSTCSVTINDGTFNGNVYNQGGTLTINGGKFSSSRLYCQSGTTYIYGGMFTGTLGSSAGTLEVYGGTFISSFSRKLTTDYLASGYTYTKVNINGTDYYVVYKSGEAVTISGLSVSNALTALSSMGTTGAVTIEAAEDSSVSAIALSTAVSSNDVTIDLNETTLTVSDNGNTVVVNGGDLTISDGTLNLNNTKDGNAYAYYSIEVDSNSSLTLDGVTLTQSSGVGIAKGASNATLTIKDSTINSTGYYGVGTNASTSTSGVVITIENSTIAVADGVDSYHDSCGVCVNIDATVTITDSTITAERQGIMLRGGTATITNTKITTTAEYSGGSYYTNGGWGTGNEVPMAAIVAGNAKGSYEYDTNLTLNNVTLTVGTRTDGVLVPAIYAASCGYTTAITGASDDDTVLAYVGGGSVSINGTTVSSSISSLTKVSDITGTN